MLRHLSAKLLPRLAASVHLNALLEDLACKALATLVRHVTLVRTLDEGAKMQVGVARRGEREGGREGESQTHTVAERQRQRQRE